MVVSCIFLKYEENKNTPYKELYIYHVSISDDDNVNDRINIVNLNKRSVVATTSSEPTNLYAKYAILMDASNRRVLYEKSGRDPVSMASTTKIMTLLIVLENANLDDVVTISDYAASMPDVQLDMKSGEKYILKDLLYSLMLESHNDTAVAVAEHVGGSVEGFAAMMNKKAKELGAYNTNFVTPNGLDAEGHYSTAYDLALISSYAIENKTFLEIINTNSYNFSEQTSGKYYTVNNKDAFLSTYEGAIGVKTGFTGNAGYCFVGAVKKDEKTLISVVLACGWPPNKTYKWKDTKKLMDYGVNQYAMKEIIAKGISFQKIPVKDSIEEESITPYVDDSVSLLLRQEENVEFEIKVPKILTAPIKKNETVGDITIYINDKKYKVLPLYSLEERSKITYEYTLCKLFYQYFLMSRG